MPDENLKPIERFERAIIMQAVALYGMGGAAEYLGMGKRTISGKLRVYGFNPYEIPTQPFSQDVQAIQEFFGMVSILGDEFTFDSGPLAGDGVVSTQ